MTICFLCLSQMHDEAESDRETITVNGFVVHKDCYESDDDE